MISDGDLVNTTLTEIVPSTTQKVINLQFLNFQPVHDSVYHCFSNTSNASVVESSDLYLYGSGEDCMCVKWMGHAYVGSAASCAIHIL